MALKIFALLGVCLIVAGMTLTLAAFHYGDLWWDDLIEVFVRSPVSINITDAGRGMNLSVISGGDGPLEIYLFNKKITITR